MTAGRDEISLKEFMEAMRRGDLQSVWFAGAALFGFGAFAWSEIQRRLEILNHENARLLAQQEKTVSQDTYSANEDQRRNEAVNLAEWRKEVDVDRSRSIFRDEFQQDSRVERRSQLDTRTRILSLGIALSLAIIALLAYIAASHATIPNPTPVTVTVTTTR